MPDLSCCHHGQPPSAARTPTAIRAARRISAVTVIAVIAAAVVRPARTGRQVTSAPPAGNTLLPISPAGLATAAGLAARFAAGYASYRYDQSAGSYLARLRPLATASLYPILANAAQAPGLRSQRARERLVAHTEAQPQSIRDIQAGAVIVVVRVSQDISSTAGRSESTAEYAVTVTTHDGRWQVYDIEPAAAGNQGGAAG